MDGTAVVVCDGLFRGYGKTAHGLIRDSDRYQVLAVIDGPETAGKDAGVVLDGKARGIPIYATLAEALANLAQRPDYCVVGIATHGGQLTDSLRSGLGEAIQAGLSIVNGLHEYTSDDPVLRAAAEANQVTLTDLRRPKPKDQLHFWHGTILGLKIPRIAVLGTDCALGKRTTTRFLLHACRAAGTKAEMIYTGQTGWMQGGKWGLVLDSITNDFVSGEIEHAIMQCAKEANPDVILLEGQSSLRNPSGPCGSELIISGGAKGVILQHAPGRKYFEGYETEQLAIPSLQEEIELIRLLGSKVLALTLNEEGLTSEDLVHAQQTLQQQLGIPVVRPLEEGVEALVPVIQTYLSSQECPR